MRGPEGLSPSTEQAILKRWPWSYGDFRRRAGRRRTAYKRRLERPGAARPALKVIIPAGAVAGLRRHNGGAESDGLEPRHR